MLFETCANNAAPPYRWRQFSMSRIHAKAFRQLWSHRTCSMPNKLPSESVRAVWSDKPLERQDEWILSNSWTAGGHGLRYFGEGRKSVQMPCCRARATRCRHRYKRRHLFHFICPNAGARHVASQTYFWSVLVCVCAVGGLLLCLGMFTCISSWLCAVSLTWFVDIFVLRNQSVLWAHSCANVHRGVFRT